LSVQGLHDQRIEDADLLQGHHICGDWFVIDFGNKDRVTVLGFIKTMVETKAFGCTKAMSCFVAV